MGLYSLTAETTNGNTVFIGNFETEAEARECAINDDSVVDLGSDLHYYWNEIQVR